MSELFSFWVGPLTWLERLCMASMLDNGHSLTVYSFEKELDVPIGVAVRDAGEVLSRDRFVCYRNGSPTLFSDLFRYEGLRQGLGTWVDLDVLLLRHIGGLGHHIVGLQDDRGTINNAVLRLPADSPILTDILEFCSRRVLVAPHWPFRRKLKQRIAGAFGLHKKLSELPWGTTGPRLITYYAGVYGLKPLPRSFFYPYPHAEAEIAFDPSVRLEDRFSDDTHAVHLWNERIKSRKTMPPPEGSFLFRMCERYGISVYEIS